MLQITAGTMGDSGHFALQSLVDGIISGSRNGQHHANHSKRTNKKVAKHDLELALAVVLVDLASCDQHFDPSEYKAISESLKRLFGTELADITPLIHQANNALKELRGTNSFAKLLHDNLNPEQKRVVLEIINDIIGADGVEDGFETYMRQRYAALIGLELPEKKAKEVQD